MLLKRCTPLQAAALTAVVSLATLAPICVCADPPSPSRSVSPSERGVRHSEPKSPSSSNASASQQTPDNASTPTTSNAATTGKPQIDRHATRGRWLAYTALAYRGARYRFGGRSSRTGFDCSGLVQVVCAKWGVYVPRVAHTQFQMGTPVTQDKLEPGDLVFFKNTYKRGISHVGIYVGDGYFVHAASHRKGVCLSKLNETYHRNHWLGARRLDLSKLPSVPGEEEEVKQVYVDDVPAPATAPAPSTPASSPTPH